MPTAAFDQLAGLLPEALLLVRADGVIASANRGAAELFGKTEAQLAECRLADLTLDTPSTVAQFLRVASRNRTLVPGRLTITALDRPPIVCRCEAAVFRPRSNAHPALVLLRLSRHDAAANRFVLLNRRIDDLSQEVGRRRRAEAMLHERSEWLRVTLLSIGDAVIATDVAGHVVLINPVAQALTGWSMADAVGRPLDEVFTIVNETTRARVESPVTRVLHEGGVVGLANSTLLIGKNGSEHPIDDSGAPILDDSGELIGVVLVFHDISERHAMERELRAKTQLLLEADRRKDEFLSMLAHELRNPLAPLRNGIQVLHRLAGMPGESLKVGQMMERQVAHLSRLVDDLLDVARVTRGSIDLRMAPVSLTSAVQEALEMSGPLLAASGHRLEVDCPDTPMVINGDATRLVQIFSNLLANAVKFTGPGGHIAVTVRHDATHASVTVRDSGMGIEAAFLPKVFELFAQSERSLDRSQGGLGVGLAIVQSLVHMHGGTVHASSPGLGHGSEFVVRLPLIGKAGSTPARAEPAPAVALGMGDARRVLVVDDNVDVAQSLAMLLEMGGHQTRIAENGPAALALANAWHPQIVLLDIGLPGMDGYEVARQLRTQSGMQRALIVAVSGYGSVQDRRRSAAAGFDHHLTKPVDPTRLLALVA